MRDAIWRDGSTWFLRPTHYEERPASAVLNRKGGKMPPPDCSLLLTGWLVGAANLPRLLPKAGHLLHREEARQLDVLNGTSGYGDAGYSRCHCGVSHVENHHRTGTIGSPTVHRDKLAPGG